MSRRPSDATAGLCFRVGDKVLQLRNNYEKEVFNGDGGVDHRTSPSKIRHSPYDWMMSALLTYEFSELDELTLAYAISIHKAQGSEYPVCVIPLAMEQYMLLERQLVYTAHHPCSPARLVLVGSKKALAIAVRNGPKPIEQMSAEMQTAKPAKAAPRHRSSRYTALCLRLRQVNSP